MPDAISSVLMIAEAIAAATANARLLPPSALHCLFPSNFRCHFCPLCKRRGSLITRLFIQTFIWTSGSRQTSRPEGCRAQLVPNPEVIQGTCFFNASVYFFFMQPF